MKKSELVNLLYVERQRLTEQNNQIGWSIWLLIGGIITLSWMLIEHYEAVILLNSADFSWSQVATLLRDFIGISFALLLVKNFYSDRKINYRSDRFNKSKLPFFILLDMIIAILLSILYGFTTYYDIGMLIIIDIFFGIKISELFEYLLIKQHMPSWFKQLIYFISFVGVLIIGGYNIYLHFTYHIVNTKYALLSCGIIILIYILFWYIWNPIKKRIIAIDKIADELIINENINMASAYNEFIAIKFGYKYSQLYENPFQEVKKILNQQYNIIALIKEKIEKLESTQNISIKMLQESLNYFRSFQKKHNVICDKSAKIILSMEGDLKQIPFNKENKQEFNKLSEIIHKNDIIIKENLKIISELIDRFSDLLSKLSTGNNISSGHSNQCKFEHNKILCYLYRRSYNVIKKISNIYRCCHK